MLRFFAVLLVIMLCLTTAFAEDNGSTLLPDSLENDQADMPPVVETLLAAEGATLAFALPETYVPQKFSSNIYTYESMEEGTLFLIDIVLNSSKDQKNLLRKVRDKSNKFILFDDVAIGNYRYLAYTSERRAENWEFLLLTADGFSYRFSYCMVDGQACDEIPDKAISISGLPAHIALISA